MIPEPPIGAIVDPEMLEFHGCDGVEIRFMHFPYASSLIAQHVHKYDHTTFIMGEAEVWRDGAYIGKFKNTGVTIEAGKQHMFKTTQPDTWIQCIHNVSRTGVIEVEA